MVQELAYDWENLAASVADQEQQLNTNQLRAYNCILDRLSNDPCHAHFFLHGASGTGKTFLYITLCECLQSEGKIILCVASTGIASLLLSGSRTAHKWFKIPIDVSDSSTCFIQQRTHLAELICNTSLIIWDETPMTKKTVFDAVDRTLRDI